MDTYVSRSGAPDIVVNAGWVMTNLFLDSSTDWTEDYYLDIDLPDQLSVVINSVTYTMRSLYAINGFCMCVQETAGDYLNVWIDDISFFCEAGRRDKYVK